MKKIFFLFYNEFKIITKCGNFHIDLFTSAKYDSLCQQKKKNSKEIML